MKLSDSGGNVEVSEGLQNQSFKIATTKKAFEILSSGLYSDKISAIIRELSTNALDSHIAAKNVDEPFIVHLPNTFEPFFSVKDFGTGLSCKNVLSLYTTYFDSNRSSSNDFTGCMGLGSKSPFSYATQFTAESNFEGVKSIFSCFIDAQGIPNVSKLSSAPTTEKNGFEVKFPVNKKDFNEFASKAASVLSWFEKRPKVVGWNNFKFEEREYEQKEKSYGVVKGAYPRGYSQVVMSNVAYRLDLDDLDGLSYDDRNIISNGIDIFLETGAVEVAANREKLSYNPATVKTLKDKLVAIKLEIAKTVEDRLKKAKTIWEARKQFTALCHSWLKMFLNNTNSIQWNGKTVTSVVRITDYVSDIQATTLRLGHSYSNKTPPIHVTNETWLTADEIPIFINDTGKKHLSRVKHYMHTKALKYAHVLTHVTAHTNAKNGDKLETTGIFEEAIKMSTLPDPPRAPRVKGTSNNNIVTTRILKWKKNTGNYQFNSSTWWEDCDKKLSDGGIYVVVWRYYATKMTDGETAVPVKVDPYQLETWINAITAITGKTPELYGVKEADVEKLEKHKGKWQLLGDYVEELRAKLWTKHSEKIELSHQWTVCCNQQLLNNFKSRISTLNVKSPFRKFIELLGDAEKASKDKDVLNYRLIPGALNLDPVKPAYDSQRLTKELDDVYTHYPMLTHVSIYNMSSDLLKKWTDYVALVDKSNGLK